MADRFGRVRTLMLTMLLYAVGTAACAGATNLWMLAIFRLVASLGIGGEWAAGAVLMGEAIRPQYRGRAVGSVQSGWAVGWGLAVLAYGVFFMAAFALPETRGRILHADA